MNSVSASIPTGHEGNSLRNLAIKPSVVRTVLLCGLAAACGAAACHAERPVVIRVGETAGIRRFQYPVAVRIKLAEPVPRETDWRLVLDDEAVLAQFRPAESGVTVADWWLDFPVNLLPYQSSTYTIKRDAEHLESPPVRRGLVLVESDNTYQVVSENAIAWTVQQDLASLLSSVRSGDLEYLHPNSTGLFLIDRNGRKHSLGGSRDDRHEAVQVIRNGPLTIGLRFEFAATDPALADVRSTVDLTFPVFKSWVEVDWQVNDPQGRLGGLGAGLDINLNAPTRDAPTLTDFGAANLVYLSLRPGQQTVLQGGPPLLTREHSASDALPPAWQVLRGRSDRMEPFVAGPRHPETPVPPEGWVHVMDRDRCLALAVEAFACDTRDQIFVSAEGIMRLGRDFLTNAASGPPVTKRLHFWLHFVPFPPQQTAATSPQSMQNPPVTRVLALDD